MRDIGPTLAPHSACLLATGVDTLPFRLPAHPHYERGKKYLPKGPGSVFSFVVKGGREGDAKTLVIHPASTTHAQLTEQQLIDAGVLPGVVRIGVRLAILRNAKSGYYRVYFVNPMVEEILGQKSYKSLADLPKVPDIVDVFRKGSDIPSVIEEVIAIGTKTVWVQLGIWNQDAAIYGESKGLTVVVDRCIKIACATRTVQLICP